MKAFITDRRVSKLRSDRVTVAPQAWGKAGALGALRPMHPVFRVGIGGARLNPSTSSRSGKALVPPGRPSGERGSILPVRPLGGCSESEARSYAAGPGFGGREPSRFLGTKRWKSQKLRQLSPQLTG